MVKKNSYIEIGDVLSAETAFIQAAHALDVAGHIAHENRDTDTLLSIAQTYVAIAERLMPHHHEEEEEDDHDPEFGFQSAVSDTIYEPELPEDELEDEDGDED